MGFQESNNECTEVLGCWKIEQNFRWQKHMNLVKSEFK